MFEKPITEKTFLNIAMKFYDNPQCATLEEFEEDLKRFSYLKKLFGRYKTDQDLKERLIINHLIVLYNVFGVITTDLLFFKIDQQFWAIMATFLVYLQRMPENIPEFNIQLSNLVLDQEIIDVLRKT